MIFTRLSDRIFVLLVYIALPAPHFALAENEHNHGAKLTQNNPLGTLMVYRVKSKIGKYIPKDPGLIDQDGKDTFKTATISFDVVDDTPDIMKGYGEQFTDDFSTRKFGTTEKETVDALTKAFVPMFVKSENLPFNRSNMVSIVHKDGMLLQQIFCVDFSENEFVRVLKILQDDMAPGDRPNN